MNEALLTCDRCGQPYVEYDAVKCDTCGKLVHDRCLSAHTHIHEAQQQYHRSLWNCVEANAS